MSDIRSRLRAALVVAMKARDPVATSALRTAIGAIDNAEAVPADTHTVEGRPSAVFGGAVVGLGASEVARRSLTEADVAAVVQREIDERITDADGYETAGQDAAAARLRAEAEVLRAHLDFPSAP